MHFYELKKVLHKILPLEVDTYIANQLQHKFHKAISDLSLQEPHLQLPTENKLLLLNFDFGFRSLWRTLCFLHICGDCLHVIHY